MGARFPFPSYPHGWFAVAFSDDLAPATVKTVHYFGRDIVLFRTERGVLSAVDKTCPHLGAHLGGGRVAGECLRCPFHDWGFAADGHVTDVPYAPKIPPKARAKTWHLAERAGVVFVWYGAEGSQPAWALPEVETEGWTPNRSIRWELASHPQEVGENTVDCSHLGPVHHVQRTTVKEVEREAHRMRVLLHLVATGAAIGMPDEINDVELDVTLNGLGVIVSQTHVITGGLRTRQRINPTPIDEGRIAIFAVANTKHMPDPAYTKEIDEIFWQAFTTDFARDFPIWENKEYLEKPLLAGGDGPIGAYRKWARQFYASPAGKTEEPPARERAKELVSLVRARGLELFERLRQRGAEAAAGPAGAASPASPAPSPKKRKFSSVEDYFQTLEKRFDASAAGELDAVFQWTLTGDRSQAHFAEVRGGTIQTREGVHAAPTVTIEMTADDYLQMINGDLNGALAFSTGRGKLSGPVRLAMRMQRIFPLDA